MTLAVFYAWDMVAWGANWLDPDRPPVRLLLVGLKFASLLMSAAIPDAFDGRAWLFVTGYLLIQIGRSLFLIIALRGRALGGHFVNDLVWELGAGALWVAGAIADADARLVLWGLAVAATYDGRRVPALAARPWPRDRTRPHRDRRRASHRAFPPLLHHRAGRNRAGDGQRVHERAV